MQMWIDYSGNGVGNLRIRLPSMSGRYYGLKGMRQLMAISKVEIAGY
jgi:hypothetical protein